MPRTMHPEDKQKLQCWLDGLADLGLKAQPLGKFWILQPQDGSEVLAIISYDPNKPPDQRFSLYGVDEDEQLN